MNLTNDCLVCIVRGSLDAARLATDDKKEQETIVKRLLKKLAAADMQTPPPMMALEIQKTIKDVTGVADPYAAKKKKYNDFALDLYPDLEKKLKGQAFEAALRICIAGNI